MNALVRVLTATLLTAASMSAAAAVGQDPNVMGRWSGYFNVTGSRVDGGAVSIQISSQDHRRFAGEICFGASCTPVLGTIAASGEITLTGRGAGVQNVEMHGTPFGGRAGVVSAIVGDYHIARGANTQRGNVVIVHQAAGDGPAADVAGAWGGQATPQGIAAATPFEVMLEVGRAGAVTGNLGWATLDVRSPIVGQAMHFNGGDHVAIAARLDDAILVLDLALSEPVGQPTRLDGEYQVFLNGNVVKNLGLCWLLFGTRTAHIQAEAVANLKAMYTAEKAYAQEKDIYSTKTNEVGFSPERNNRYRYVLAADPVTLEDRSGVVPVVLDSNEGIDVDLFKYPTALYPKIKNGPCVGTPVWGVTQLGTVFTGAAYGDIDSDSTLDVWTVSTAARWLSGSGCDAVGYIPAGLPANEQNDMLR